MFLDTAPPERQDQPSMTDAQIAECLDVALALHTLVEVLHAARMNSAGAVVPYRNHVLTQVAQCTRMLSGGHDTY